MLVLITGASLGIGRAAARMFLETGHYVVGLDTRVSTIHHAHYEHWVCDVSNRSTLPDIPAVDVLVNNAGVQGTDKDIEVNLLGTIYCTEKYGLRPGIKSIVNVASTSAHTGAEFPLYAASKGGVLAYTKHTAMEVASYCATCNSISPGGVVTHINDHILNSPKLFEKVLEETLLRKWASAEEIAEWIYFLAVVNKSMTGQDVVIDNGEMAKYNFIW